MSKTDKIQRDQYYNFKTTIRNMLEASSNEPFDNRLEFRADDIINASKGSLVNRTYVSTILNLLRRKGLADKIRHGGAKHKAVWDFTKWFDFIESGGDEEDLLYDTTPNVGRPRTQARHLAALGNEQPPVSKIVSVPPVEAISEEEPSAQEEKEVAVVSPSDVQEEIKSMISFFQDIPSQMISHLHGMIDALETKKAKESITREEVDEIKEQVAKYKSEIDMLSFQLKQAKSKSFNSHRIVRYRNAILDEIERFMSAPGWQKNPENFRKTINSNLNQILSEVGINQEQNV
jgi:hypothetical protein